MSTTGCSYGRRFSLGGRLRRNGTGSPGMLSSSPDSGSGRDSLRWAVCRRPASILFVGAQAQRRVQIGQDGVEHCVSCGVKHDVVPSPG